MVNRPLSSRDLELLSAYLDQQLSPLQRQRLEERLHLNPALQNALDELRRTRAMLRSLPKVIAPRNFTLTPAMLPARRPQIFFGLPLNWTVASALATFFLFVFFAGDFLGLFSPSSTMQTAQRPSDAMALETAMSQIEAQSKASPEDTQEPAFAMPLAPENTRGMGGGGGGGPEATLQTFPLTLTTPPPSADQPIILPTPSPTELVVQPMLESAASGTATTTLMVESAPGTEMASVPPTGQPGISAQPQPESVTPPQVLFTPWWVRIIEVALLLIALGAGVFAFTRRAR